MSLINGAFAEELYDTYGVEIVDQIAGPTALKAATLPDQPRESIPYIEITAPEAEIDRPIFLVPGYCGGIVQKAALAAELAAQGRNVILPGQNRSGTSKNEHGKRSATYNQARNYLAVMNQTVGPDAADIVTNSYGSLEFNEMVRLEPERFIESDAVLLAPAGSIRNQRLLAMGVQWLEMMTIGTFQERPKEFIDEKGAMRKASAAVFTANPIRAIREIGDLWQREVDYRRLARATHSVSVLNYAEDKMFPDGKLEPMLSDTVNEGFVTWATPYNAKKSTSKQPAERSEGAVHDDEQWNPKRVANALLEIMAQGQRR